MNDILDAVSARIKAPYFGYALLAFIGLNWRGLFLLAVMDATPQERLAAFDAETSIRSLLIFPLLTGAVVTLASPWIRLLFSTLSQWPFEKMDNQSLEAENKKIIKKTRLEQSRSRLFADKESELIERAKRDEEVLEIENEQLKQELAQKIESLRRERERLSGDSAVSATFTVAEKQLLKAAAKNGSGVIFRLETLGGRSIEAGSLTFGGENHREFSKYDSALRSLLEKDLVSGVDPGGEQFELTHSGWNVADTL